MKSILEFNLDEEEDIYRHKLMLKSQDLFSALCEISSMLREKLKYEELEENERVFLEKTRDKFFEILEENNIKLDELGQ